MMKKDVVEVVRCRNCIFKDDGEEENEIYCEQHHAYFRKSDFCNYGKKYESVKKQEKWIDNSTSTLKTVKCSACGNTFQGYYENYLY